MRNYVENARLCGNMRKITKCAENNKLLKTVNCAIPHPSHLMGASDSDEYSGHFLMYELYIDCVTCPSVVLTLF